MIFECRPWNIRDIAGGAAAGTLAVLNITREIAKLYKKIIVSSSAIFFKEKEKTFVLSPRFFRIAPRETDKFTSPLLRRNYKSPSQKRYLVIHNYVVDIDNRLKTGFAKNPAFVSTDLAEYKLEIARECEFRKSIRCKERTRNMSFFFSNDDQNFALLARKFVF